MQRSVPTSLRVALALVLLALVVLYASTVVGRYRSSQAAEAASQPGASAPSTTTPKPKTATPPAAEEGEGEATEADTEKKPASKGPAVVVKVDGLNFREEPNKDAKVIRGLDAGERLAVIEQKDGWYYAEDSGGEKGWLYGSEQYSTLEE